MNIQERIKNVARARMHLAALGCLVVASLVFRIYVSNRCSLWYDEVWTLYDSSAPWPELLRGPSREHPPLMYVLVRLVTDVFGTSELALRAVSLFFGCVLLVAVYLLCLELAFTKTEALVGVVFVALGPFFIRHAVEARQYAMLAALTTLELVFVLRLLREPGDFRSLVGVALSAAAASATQYFGLAYACALLGALAFGTFPAWRHCLVPPRIPRRTAVVLAGLGLALAAVTLRAVMLALFYNTHRVGPRGGDLPTGTLVNFAFFAAGKRGVVAQAIIAGIGLVIVGFRLRGIARLLPFAIGLPPIGLAVLISSGHRVLPRYLVSSWVLYQVGMVAVVLAVVRLVRGGRSTWERGLRTALAAPLVLVPLAGRIAEYPAGFGAGSEYYAGLQAYFAHGRARGTALAVFPKFSGYFIMSEGYPVDAPLVPLDFFEPVPGIRHYLIAEFESPSQTPVLEDLLLRHFHLSRQRWRSLPIVHLPHSVFQRPVRARLVRLP